MYSVIWHGHAEVENLGRSEEEQNRSGVQYQMKRNLRWSHLTHPTVAHGTVAPTTDRAAVYAPSQTSHTNADPLSSQGNATSSVAPTTRASNSSAGFALSHTSHPSSNPSSPQGNETPSTSTADVVLPSDAPTITSATSSVAPTTRASNSAAGFAPSQTSHPSSNPSSPQGNATPSTSSADVELPSDAPTITSLTPTAVQYVPTPFADTSEVESLFPSPQRPPRIDINPKEENKGLMAVTEAFIALACTASLVSVVAVWYRRRRRNSEGRSTKSHADPNETMDDEQYEDDGQKVVWSLATFEDDDVESATGERYQHVLFRDSVGSSRETLTQ